MADGEVVVSLAAATALLPEVAWLFTGLLLST